MKQLFDRKRSNGLETPFTTLVETIQGQMADSRPVSAEVARASLSLESMSENHERTLNDLAENLSSSLESIAANLNISVEGYQVTAASIAGIVSADPAAFLSRKMPAMVSTENMRVVATAPGEGFEQRPIAMEAYDERDNRNAAVFSLAYNMQASRQDEASETFFPTIVLTPDQNGIAISVRLMMVYNEFKRQISGALDQYGKKNIIRAVVDPSILKNETTRIVPVHRPESADKFVAAATIAPRNVVLEGETISTSALLTGKRLNLIGLSQTDALLQSGVMDMTDTIEPAIRLQYLYVKFGDDVLRFDVSNLPLSEFTYSTQDNYRVFRLNFTTDSVLVNKDTLQVDGSALVSLAGVVTEDLIFRLKIDASGQVNHETGETVVFGNNVSVHIARNSSGEEVPLDAAPADAIVAVLDAGEILGYELIAYRSNLNRRQRGQLIDTTYYTQVYNVNFSAPITAIHPVTMSGETDASDLQSLVTATRIRTSNNAIKSLIDAAQSLSEYVDARDTLGVGPDMLGTGRFYVRPTYFHRAVNMNDIVDSIKSHERAKDIQEALVSLIRDFVYRMYRDSEYKAAADAFAGGAAPTPTAIIMTDPVIARYLSITGDLRTLGGSFDCRVVSTLDQRVAGKIFISFGVFDESRNTSPNPLNFGNMLWSPELTVVLPIARDGQISKELAVSPRFRHIVNLPVMTVLQISNIPDVLNKVPLNMRQI